MAETPGQGTASLGAPALGAEAKYLQLADVLRKQMQSGLLKPGDRLPTYAEMNAEYGVAINTVEKIHALLEREGLIVKQLRKGTFVAPRRRLTGCLGLVKPRESYASMPYWVHLIEGVEEAAHNLNYELLTLNPRSANVSSDRMDGVLTLVDPHGLAYVPPPACPHVFLLFRDEDMSWVGADETAGMELAVHHLVKLGHRRIGFLVASHSYSRVLRLAGYRQALANQGIEGDAAWIRFYDIPPEHGGQRSVGQLEMEAWLRAGWHETGCTALVCQNDETAMGAMTALRGAGLTIPGDVSVVGFDGTELCQMSTPTLTSVRMPLREIGKTGVSLLIERINTQATAVTSRELPTRLRIGDSTGPASSLEIS